MYISDIHCKWQTGFGMCTSGLNSILHILPSGYNNIIMKYLQYKVKMRKILICHKHVDGFEKYICTCISVKYQVIFIS